MLIALLAQVSPPPFKDWTAAAIVAVTPVVIGIIAWVMENHGAAIPFWLKPLLASALGSAVAYLGTVVTGDPILIAIIGLATIGLREIIVRLGQATGLMARKT